MELVGRLRRYYSNSGEEHSHSKDAAAGGSGGDASLHDVEPAVEAMHNSAAHGAVAWIRRRRSSLHDHLQHAWRRHETEPDVPSSSKDDNAVYQHKRNALKERVRAAVNNVKYGWSWKQSAHFDSELPLWLLGRMYHSHKFDTRDDMARMSLVPRTDDFDLSDFYAAFSSRIWLTYRSGMAPMVSGGGGRAEPLAHRSAAASADGDGVTSDCGWGCMLRSGQMLAAQALTLHLLGARWSLHGAQSESERRAYHKLISYFGDAAGSALSVHNMVRQAHAYGKSVGEWYGPATVALLIRDAFREAEGYSDPTLSQMRVHVARDCTVSLQEIDELCCANARSSRASSDDEPLQWDHSLLLLVPLRLGADKLNMLYSSHIRTLFSLESFCGIMGGRPSHSMYFVGWHDRSLIYLDPHFCQDAVDTQAAHFDTTSYHCHWPRKLKFAEMDPSIAVGFYCRDRAAWIALLDHIKHIVEVESSSVNLRHALFSVVCHTPSWRHGANAPPSPAGGGKCEQSTSSSRRASAMKHGFELL